MKNDQQIIEQTKKWINDVVIGCNFCPFAANVVKQNSVHYQVERMETPGIWKKTLLTELKRLDTDKSIETSFIIFSYSFEKFDAYLGMLSLAEKLLIKNGYEGIYQIASFHPLYQFAGTNENDASNYTNRSIYPMLHLLREESIDKALANYNDPHEIPERNINFAKEKGVKYMKMLRDACL